MGIIFLGLLLVGIVDSMKDGGQSSHEIIGIIVLFISQIFDGA